MADTNHTPLTLGQITHSLTEWTNDEWENIEQRGYQYHVVVPLDSSRKVIPLPTNIINDILHSIGKKFFRILMSLGRYTPLTNNTSSIVSVALCDYRKIHPTIICQVGFPGNEVHAFYLEMPHAVYKQDANKIKLAIEIENADFTQGTVGAHIICYITVQYSNMATLHHEITVDAIPMPRQAAYLTNNFKDFTKLLCDMSMFNKSGKNNKELSDIPNLINDDIKKKWSTHRQVVVNNEDDEDDNTRVDDLTEGIKKFIDLNTNHNDSKYYRIKNELVLNK